MKKEYFRSNMKGKNNNNKGKEVELKLRKQQSSSDVHHHYQQRNKNKKFFNVITTRRITNVKTVAILFLSILVVIMSSTIGWLSVIIENNESFGGVGFNNERSSSMIFQQSSSYQQKTSSSLSSSDYSYCDTTTTTSNGRTSKIILESRYLKKLRSLLLKDPQYYALRNVTFIEEEDTTTNTILVEGLTPKLIERGYIGSNILLLGDSTLYYLMKWLYRLLEANSNNFGSIENLNLDDGNIFINPTMDKHLEMKKGNPLPYLDSKTNTFIRWKGYTGAKDSSSKNGPCNLVAKFMLTNTSTSTQPPPPPDILIVNMGLHWMHFENKARDIAHPCVVDRWVHYEDFLQEVLDNAAYGQVKLVLFKTTNYICSSKYTDEFAEANQQYYSSNQSSLIVDDALNECQQSITKKLVGYKSSRGTNTITVDEIKLYCRYGIFNDIASQYLNQRLRLWVKQKQQQMQQQQSASNTTYMPQIAIFDDYSIESCNYTLEGDGRHYHPLNLLRIRLLANILACYK